MAHKNTKKTASLILFLKVFILSLFLFSCFTHASTRAQTGDITLIEDVLKLNQMSDRVKVNNLKFFIDTKNAHSLKTIKRLTKNEWQDSFERNPSFGITANEHWFKVAIQNTASTHQSFVALVEYTALDNVDFYLERTSSHPLQFNFQTGDRHSFSSRPIEHLSFAFPFSLASQEKATAFFKISTGGSLTVPISFSTHRHFFQNQKNLFLTFGLVIGILLITGLYNLFVFVRTKEFIFLTFSFFVISVSLLFTNQSGIAYLYFWPESPNLE